MPETSGLRFGLSLKKLCQILKPTRGRDYVDFSTWAAMPDMHITVREASFSRPSSMTLTAIYGRISVWIIMGRRRQDSHRAVMVLTAVENVGGKLCAPNLCTAWRGSTAEPAVIGM